MRQNTVFLTEIMLGVKYVGYDKGRNSHFSPLVECFTQHNRLMFKLPCRRLVGKMIIICLSSLMSLFLLDTNWNIITVLRKSYRSLTSPKHKLHCWVPKYSLCGNKGKSESPTSSVGTEIGLLKNYNLNRKDTMALLGSIQ